MDDDKHIFEFYIKHNKFPEDSDKNQYKNFRDYLMREETGNKKNSENKKIKNKTVYSTDKNIDEEYNYKIFSDYIKNIPSNISIKKDIPNKKNTYTKNRGNKSKIRPQDKLDLHGLTQVQALRKLDIFIHSSISMGYIQVLVIHGKGYHSDNGKSVLKETVECYVRTDGKEYIIRMSEAPPKLGGSGAKILWLK